MQWGKEREMKFRREEFINRALFEAERPPSQKMRRSNQAKPQKRLKRS